MILDSINILNFKNIGDASLEFSPKVNCLIGNNGMGKTNVLDAIYYLSFCKSYAHRSDTDIIYHDAEFAMLQGHYLRRDVEENIIVSIQRGKRKIVRRNGKEYQRLSNHIGLLPVVMVSPQDWELIRGAGEERRRLIDLIISQNNKEYLDSLIRYNKAIEQRNSMIRHEMRDPILYETVENQAVTAAHFIYNARRQWVDDFTPVFLQHYRSIAGSDETVELVYNSHLHSRSLEELFSTTRDRDYAVGYTTSGVHRDDLDLLLNGHSMRKIGSQGQCKTYTIALRLAQFDFLKKGNPTMPILLLDDIFDRLDAARVENIIKIVSSANFGQIFITDTNRSHLDRIMHNVGGDFALFEVSHGACKIIDRGGA